MCPYLLNFPTAPLLSCASINSRDTDSIPIQRINSTQMGVGVVVKADTRALLHGKQRTFASTLHVVGFLALSPKALLLVS